MKYHSLHRCARRARQFGFSLGCATAAALAVVASAQPVRPATAAEEFLVVDCLLPGQVRQLGRQTTYVAARRPAKLTARDCAIRGGEYVAADRASGETSLRVWLAAAETGDPEAAAIVGEIQERGLAGQADYPSAASWYRRAAAAGSRRAKVNLGFLYERGLGVERNPSEALRWYRSAAGEDSPLALDAGATMDRALPAEDQRVIAALEQQAAMLRAEVAQLREALTRRDDAPAPPQPDPRPPAPPRGPTESELQARATVQQLNAQIGELQTQIQATYTRAESELAQARQREAEREAELRRSGAALAEQRAAAEAGRRRIDVLERALQSGQRDTELQRATAERLLAELAALRGRLAAREREAVQQAAAATRALADLAGPEVSIIDPPVTATRGVVTVAAAGSGSSRTIIGRVVAPAGLLKLSLNGRDLKPNDYGVFSGSLPDTPESAPVPVSIVAIDLQGKRAAVDFQLRPSAAGAAIATAAGVSGTTASTLAAERSALGKARYHALIIGNNEYSRLTDLKTPIDDARALETVLRERYGFTITLLTNATRYDVLSALNAMREKLSSDDRLLVYYAGHGELDTANSRSYWLPIDAEPNSTANWVPSVTITDLLNIIRAQHVLLVVDSCYSGALTRSSVPRLSTAMTRAERLNWLRRVASKRSRIVMTSGGLEPVLDAGGGSHSVFANALLEVLRSNRQVLDGQSLFREVAARVTYAAERVGFDQVPEYAPIRFAGHEGGEFHFVPAEY